jgi:hypothetical protein
LCANNSLVCVKVVKQREMQELRLPPCCG